MAVWAWEDVFCEINRLIKFSWLATECLLTFMQLIKSVNSLK